MSEGLDTLAETPDSLLLRAREELEVFRKALGSIKPGSSFKDLYEIKDKVWTAIYRCEEVGLDVSSLWTIYRQIVGDLEKQALLMNAQSHLGVLKGTLPDLWGRNDRVDYDAYEAIERAERAGVDVAALREQYNQALASRGCTLHSH